MAQANKNQKTTEGTARKSGTSRAAKQGKKQDDYLQDEIPPFLQAEVMIIISFVAAVLLFLSNFHLCGVVGDFLRKLQLGMFGVVGYIVPFLIFIGTSFYMANRGNRKAVIKLSAVIVAALVTCGFAQVLFGEKLGDGETLLAYYEISSLKGSGGGLVGGVLSHGLQSVIGTVGTYLVFLAAFVICGVCITEKSVVNAVKNGGDRAYQYAREDAVRRREEREERMEERRRLREDNVVRGVDFGALTIGESQAFRENPETAGRNAEQTAGKGRRKKPFEEEIMREEALLQQEFPESGPVLGASKREEDQEGPSPADIFTGKIDVPPEYEEPIPFEEDRPEQKVLSFNRRNTKKKDGPLYADREIMTLEEMNAALYSSDYPEEYGKGSPQQESGRMEDEVLFMPAGPDEETAFRQEMPAGSRQETAGLAAGGGQPAREADLEEAGQAEAEESGFLDTEEEGQIEEISLQGSPDYDFSEEDLEEDFLDQDYSFEEDGFLEEEPEPYRPEPGQAGLNGGHIFVPEEPKRVVTANGKIIETETELLQKRIEQKREESVKEGRIPNAPAANKPEAVKKPYVFPSTSLLKKSAKAPGSFSEQEYKDTAIKLQQTLRNFGVGVTVTNISCGPTVTRYELHPEQGVKVSKIVGLADDIKLSLAAAEIRIEAPIPGKSAVGIEVPNKENSIVYLRELLESDGFTSSKSRLTFAVGKDIAGQPVVADIGKMPHLLIAGATGSGKSVCINTLIMSIIYKADPEDVKLIMVDPKVVELSVYNGIPHLLIPVVTDPKKASGALNWAVAEMGDRYKKFAEYNVRDLKGYNEKIKNLEGIPEEKRPKKLPQIVIIVDELADLMMVVPGEVEDAICRLAQLARAAGIHLVIATQRPSVNVITGLIKANVPSRIAFSVSSGVDSRTIIDMNGAEKLLGKGDMLFYPSGVPKPQRVQGAFVSDQEVSQVVEFLTQQGPGADYSPEVESKLMSPAMDMGGGADGSRDEYFAQAGKFIIEKEKASIGMLQRVFKIGFNRAARIMDQLADAGVVGEEEGTKPRKVLMNMDEFEQFISGGNG